MSELTLNPWRDYSRGSSVLPLTRDLTVPPDWQKASAGMPSSAMEGLRSAIQTSTDPDSYKSTNPASALEEALGSLTGSSPDPSQLKHADIPVNTLSALAAKLVGQDRSFASGGMARDAVSQLMAILPALQMQQKQAGMPMPMPQGGPPAGARPMGMYVGGSPDRAAGDGVSDSIDAKLSSGEYVIPADVVSGLGKGSSEAGAKLLDDLIAQVREMHGQHIQSMPPPK